MTGQETAPLPGREDILDSLVAALPVWQLTAFRFNDAVADELGIAGSDLQCLFLLDHAGPATPGAIADRIGLTTGSTSRMIDRLVAAEMVTRDPDPADRRRVIVTIRPAASGRLHAVYDPLDDQLRGLLDRMADEGLAELLRFVGDAIVVTSASPPLGPDRPSRVSELG